jgi:hypothetical protein
VSLLDIFKGILQMDKQQNSLPVGSKQNQSLADAALKIALANVGQKEATGNNDGAFVNMVQEFVGGKPEDGAPWCACFRSWCMAQAGKPVTPKSDSSTWLYGYAEKNGLLLSNPVPGCTGLVKGNGGSAGKSHHHTFAVISINLEQGVIDTVDGNWGNAVSKTQHRIKDCDFMACV